MVSVLPEIMSVITEIFPDSHSNYYIKEMIAKTHSQSPTAFPSTITFFPVMQHFGLVPFPHMTLKSFQSSMLLGQFQAVIVDFNKHITAYLADHKLQ